MAEKLVTVEGSVSITGQVATREAAPASGDIRTGAATSTGTLFSVPAGRIWKGSLSLSSSVTVAGNGSCSISSADTGGGSGATTGTLHQISCQGLALTVASNSNTISDVHVYGGTNGATVSFTQGAAGTTMGQANGILL